MELSRRTEVIRRESDTLADVARGHFDVAIPTCPAWTMRDLVRHVFDVRRGWDHIVRAGLLEPSFPGQLDVPDDELLDEFVKNAHTFADLLEETDPDKPCWTWGPTNTAGFVQHFQVQETALHRWDGQHAIG